MDRTRVKLMIEALLLASPEPVDERQMVQMLEAEMEEPSLAKKIIREILHEMRDECAHHAYELQRVASGYRYQILPEYGQWVNKVFARQPPRYSRALLETLALIAYRQPVTRGDIESVRGVTVRYSIIRTLLDREWIREVGRREVPGRPILYGTTPSFLDYFNISSLEELPQLEEIENVIDPLLTKELKISDEGGRFCDNDKLIDTVMHEDDRGINRSKPSYS